MAPLSAAQAHADRSAIGPLYRFASRVSTALVVPLAGLLAFAGADILSLYRPETAAALPLLYVLVTARAVEAIVGPATPVVELTDHRLLPLVHSFDGIALSVGLERWLVPEFVTLGMTLAAGATPLHLPPPATIDPPLSAPPHTSDPRVAP